MAKVFTSLGYDIVSGGTDNHLMLIDLRSKGNDITGKAVENAFVTSGIRIGSAAMTSRGFVEKDCEQVIEWIDHVVKNIDNDSAIKEVRNNVNNYMTNFPLYM